MWINRVLIVLMLHNFNFKILRIIQMFETNFLGMPRKGYGSEIAGVQLNWKCIYTGILVYLVYRTTDEYLLEVWPGFVFFTTLTRIVPTNTR